MKIIITGSLGHISKPLASELISKGHAVTVISSNPEKQKGIEALDAIAAIGALGDTDFLASAFEGADAVYAMVPPNFGAPDSREYYRQIANSYAQAIRRSGVKHLVHLSSMGAHLDKGTGFILGSYDSENILNALPAVTITHLRPTYFYYNLNNFAEMIKAAGIMGANYGGDDKILMVSPMDIASVAAEEITTSTTARKVRYITSDERMADEVAHVLGSAIGKPDLKWIKFTNDQMRKGMEERGTPENIINNFIEIGESVHSGKLREDYDLNKPVMGKVKLEDFAKEFAAAY